MSSGRRNRHQSKAFITQSPFGSSRSGGIELQKGAASSESWRECESECEIATKSPITLPEEAPDDFVAEFNRTYASIGWTIERLRPKSKGKD